MSEDKDARELKRYFQNIIDSVDETISKLDSSDKISNDDESVRSSILNSENDTFTLNEKDNELMDELKTSIETYLADCLRHLSKICQKYLLNFLHQYEYDPDTEQFKNIFSRSTLPSFQLDLKAILASLDAFPAAWNGTLTIVKDFVINYPSFKDKPGLWGTTLLYSAAKNNKLNVVKYLIETAQCSSNAQNEQQLEKSLLKTIKGAKVHIEVLPSAASTALHGACFSGHLDIVKYLINKNADYFIRNQADETPIDNGKHHPDIVDFFRNYLVLGYSTNLDILPNSTIMDNTEERQTDCIWEYKPFDTNRWYGFSPVESEELQNSLLIKPNEKFKHELFLRLRTTIYSVSTIQFLRSGKGVDKENNLAWVRCRGSSIQNFDCYSLWQIMFTKHPEDESDSSSPSLKVFNIPTIYNNQFKIKLNTWYNCHAKTNSLLDEAINYRKKIIECYLDFISDDQLIFNLHTFSFNNKNSTIQGFIRWIPKLISNNHQNKNKLKSIDNFSALTNLDPIPLTTKHLQQVLQVNHPITLTDEDLFEDENEDVDILTNTGNSNDDDDDRITDKETISPASSVWSLRDTTADDDDAVSINDSSDNNYKSPTAKTTVTNYVGTKEQTTTNYADTKPEPIHDFLRQNNQSSSSSQLIEKVNSTTNDQIRKSALEELKKENQLVKADLEKETEKVNSQVSLNQQNKIQFKNELDEHLKQIDQLNQQLSNIQKQEENLIKLSNQIKTIDYNNIDKQIIQRYLTPKFSLILNQLKSSTNKLDHNFIDKIPRLIFAEKNNTFTISITGFDVHQNAFKDILKRLIDLNNIHQKAKEYYQRQLKKINQSIQQILRQVKSKTQNWKQYSQILSDLFKQKITDYSNQFNLFIEQKTIEISEEFISDNSISPWNEIQKYTEQFMKEFYFQDQIESLKQEAFQLFITQNISFQRLKIDKKPTNKSIEVLKNFIDKIKNSFQKESIYIGYELKHFSLIPHLLQRLMIYYSCFALQLPLYESAIQLLDHIDKNTVLTIATSTGSGKSTLLPALLIAEGYDKVIVTQPRRLPCSLISDRVNETMITDTNPRVEKLAGWAVSGAEKNSRAKILYLTDGLLKERLVYDENFLPTNISVQKSIVLFIDEVHERSVNIDLCLALIARILKVKKELITKIKIIISSATLDSSVGNLFSKIPNIKFYQFNIPAMGTIHTVTKFNRPNENVLDIVQELYKKRQRHDQILCFVNSVGEVNQCCRLLAEISRGTIVAYPLIQSQHASTQQHYIEHGSVFFSTTVAETSLTFPSLKYVIDTGMINIPFFDYESNKTVLKEVRAAESTIKQRLGRLGRTKPGEYYSLYDFDPKDKPFPTPQICQSDLINIEFSLRRSPLQNGLNHLKQFLPDPPTQKSIDFTIQQLRALDVLEAAPSTELTNEGKILGKLPDFGSVPMSKCVLAALTTYGCGRDLICLSSMLGVLNTTNIFKGLPQNLKSSDGDFMTLLNIMNEILLVKQSVSAKEFRLERVCQAKGLSNIKHLIGQALRRYTNLEKSFNLLKEFRQKAQKSSGQWEMIAKSLLTGYNDNVFVSMKDLQDRIHQFVRYSDRNDIAVLDLQSTLTRPISQSPVSLILVRDVRYLSVIRSTAILSFAGEIKAEWIEYPLKREIYLFTEEQTYLNTNNKYTNAQSKFSKKINILLNNQIISLKGPAGEVLNAELHLRQEMITEYTFNLENKNHADTALYANLSRNLESVMKMTRIFNPLIWRWQSQKQVKITVNSDTATKTCKITVVGRDSDIKKVKEEFDSFLGWLQYCAVIRHPNGGVPPRILRPQMRKDCLDIEEKISHITDSNRTLIDLYNGVRGSKATRETRMEVVAWIAVCKFDCRLEGGFVRDWVVGNYISTPNKNPKTWIDYVQNNKNENIPYIVKEVVPGDLDCHLPSHQYFDIDKFQDELFKFDIKCKVYRENWRYVILIDEDYRTGPFTMDLIEPHVALTHDRIDFDVNNLSLEKDFTRDLAMRVDIQQKPYSIELEKIVDNIKNKRFQVLRPIDKQVKERIHKMVNIRGWTQLGEAFHVIPEPPAKYYALLVPLPASTELYQVLTTQMRTISASLQIISIEQVKNPYLEDSYEAMKKIIGKQCPGFDPKERTLFHGTKGPGITGITEDGFDDRFFVPTGAWGHGAYFADDPQKSHGYTEPDATNQTRVMFYNKVLLGKQSIQTTTNNALVSAPKDHHSVQGTGFKYTEYIVYRYGQALPYLKMTYKV